jgi:hypothetical protein
MVIAWANDEYIPTGWAKCDGKLYTIEPTTGKTIESPSGFKTPDLRGRFVLGSGDVNIDDRTFNTNRTFMLNDKGGNEVHYLKSDEMPAHTHNYDDRISNAPKRKTTEDTDYDRPFEIIGYDFIDRAYFDSTEPGIGDWHTYQDEGTITTTGTNVNLTNAVRAGNHGRKIWGKKDVKTKSTEYCLNMTYLLYLLMFVQTILNNINNFTYYYFNTML